MKNIVYKKIIINIRPLYICNNHRPLCEATGSNYEFKVQLQGVHDLNTLISLNSFFIITYSIHGIRSTTIALQIFIQFDS